MPDEIKYVPKGWGGEYWIHNDELYCGKKLILKAGKRCSLHYHKLKTETFYVQSGKLKMEIMFPDGREETWIMGPGDHQHLPVETTHRFTGIEDSEIFEFSTQHFDDDSHRIEPGDTLDSSSHA
ncbi:cupin domain-containing protein [bacterium]|nr:cupin domain-containing protein [bacterium]